MNLTNKLFKRMFAIVAAFTLVFTVAACETGSPLDEALDNVSIVYSAGDTDVAVTQNVSLPTTYGDATISWTSSNQNVVSNDGTVTRGFDDVSVTLTARVELGEEVGTVSFTLTVLGYDADAMLDDIALTGTNIMYDETLELFGVTGDFTIPQAVDGFTVSWESSAPAIVSTDGVVVIPEYGEPDAFVTLTASINGVELEFELLVKASTVAPDPDLIRLEEAKTALLISGVADGVLVDVDLPMFVGAEGSADRVSVSWSSSDPNVLADDGTVTRPAPGAGNVTVTMTATLALNGKTVTKDFILVVIEEVSATPTDSIADAIAKSLDENGAVVEFYANIPGVTILGITADGVVIMDETGILFMYGADGDDLAIGEVYDVQGVTDNYFGAWQLSSGNGQPIVFIPSTEAATPFNPTVSNSVNDVLANTDIPGTGEFFEYKYYEVEAKVVVTDPNDRYGTFLADVSYTGDGSEFGVDPNSAQELNAWVIYYASNYKELHAFDGLDVTLEVLMYSYRTDRTIFTGLFFGTAADVEVNLTDAETVDLIEEVIENTTSENFIADTTLDLPATLFGATITYASNSSLLDVTTGNLTMPADGQEAITLTATITLNGETSTAEFTILVGEPNLVTIADARLEAPGTPVYIKGVITSISYNTQYSNAAVYIQDGTAGMYLFRLTNSANLEVGDEIEIKGYTDVYNGLIQVKDVYEMSVLSSDNVFAAQKLESGVDPITLQSQYIFVYGTLDITPNITTTSRDTSVSVTYGTGESMTIYVPAEGDFADTTVRDAIVAKLNGLTSGDEVSIFGALGWFNTGQLYVTDPEQIFIGEYKELDDAESVAEDLKVLTLASEITAAGTLTLPANGTFGSSFAWASSNDAVIDPATGTVTLPATGNVDVTLTVTATKGSESDTKTFTITVGIIVVDVVDARAAEVGDTVTVEVLITDIATDDSGRVVAFAQDATAGIYLYKIPADLAGNLAVGDLVEITGQRAEYGNLVQLSSFVRVEIISSGNTVTANPVTDPTTLAAVQGAFVEVSGYLREAYTGTPSDFFLETADGTFQLRLVSGSDQTDALRDATQAKLVGVDAGSYITVQAGVGQFFSTIQLMLLNADNITVGAVGSDADLLPIAVANTTLPEAADLIADVTLPTTTILGVTIAWTSSNDAVIATDGTVTRPTDADVTVTMSYTFTLGNETDTGSVDFVVKMIDDSVVTYTETFTNLDLTGTSYGAGSFVGDNGVTWNYTESRGDFTLDGKAIMLDKDGDGASLSATIQGGISTFSVEFYDAYSGAAQIELYINDVLVGTSDAHDGDDDDTPVTFTLAGLDTEGEFKLEILSGDSQMVIDNLSWTPYAEAPATGGPDLFISEYIEGSSNNKAIELFNGTGAALDLTGYVLKYYNNGATDDNGGTVKAFDFTGITLENGQTFTIVTDTFAGTGTYDEVQAFADADSVVFFNGDDTLILYKNGVAIDVVGVLGEDPWTLDGATVAWVNKTYVRNPEVTGPSATWDPTEWTEYAEDDFSNLGSHTMTQAVAQNPLRDETIDALTNVEGSIYTPAWVLSGEYTIDGNSVTATYLDSVLFDDETAALYDFARYLGTLFRQEGSTITTIKYLDVTYTWNETVGLVGSNWVDDSNNTLVSVVANTVTPNTPAQFTVLSNDYEYTFTMTQVIAPNPLRAQAIEALTNVEGSIYTPAWVLTGAFTLEGNNVTATYQQADLVADQSASVNDLARYLGTLYRQTGSTVTSIEYLGVTYTWDVNGGLIGSNWVDGSGTTLVSVVADNVTPGSTASFTINNDDYAYTFNITLVVEAPSI